MVLLEICVLTEGTLAAVALLEACLTAELVT
jgi:hypothetical protein